MTPETRAAVAFIAGRVILRSTSHTVFDLARERYTHYNGSVSDTVVNVFDHRQNTHISGHLPSLTFHGQGLLLLQIKESRFEGFDQTSQTHFFGQVAGGRISLFDFGPRSFFGYILQ